MSNAIGRLKEIAEQTGEPIEEMIPRIVREEGSTNKAANRLSVTPNAIRYWMVKLGYKPRFRNAVTWEKETVSE